MENERRRLTHPTIEYHDLSNLYKELAVDRESRDSQKQEVANTHDQVGYQWIFDISHVQ